MDVAAQHRTADLAAAQHGDPVGDLLDLVHFMGDKDDRTTGSRHLLHVYKQFRRFLRCQHRRRFIENQHPRAPVKHPYDLDPLLLADRQLPDRRIRVHRQTEPGFKRLDFLADCCIRQQEGPAPLAQLDVLRHRERLDQLKMLMDHAYPRLDRIPRRSESYRRPIDQDFSCIRLI